jgi:hypothetical protein
MTFTRDIHFAVARQGSVSALQIGRLQVGPIEEIGPGRFCCHFTISHFHEPVGNIYGEDPLDAFENCLVFLRKLITGFEEDGHELWWQEEGDHCGISVCFAE